MTLLLSLKDIDIILNYRLLGYNGLSTAEMVGCKSVMKPNLDRYRADKEPIKSQ